MKSESLTELKSRFEKVNRFLEVVYDKQIRLSQLLIAQGESLDQIAKWQKNKEWLQNFLTGFETKLTTSLTQTLSKRSVKILNNYYGLTATEDKRIDQIAATFGISVSQAENELRKTVSFLRTQKGREFIETAIHSASKTAHYITVELGNASYIWTGTIWIEANTFISPPDGIVRKLNSCIAAKIQHEDNTISDTQEILDRARAARDTLQYSRAISLARRVLELEHDNLAAAAILSSALRANGKPQQALLETEAFRDTDYSPLLTSRAAALCDLKRWEEAKKTIGRCLAISKSETAFSVVNRIKSERPDLYEKED